MPDENDQRFTGRPLAVDSAQAAQRTLCPVFSRSLWVRPCTMVSAFLADAVVDGFTFGAITDFQAEPTTEGDAFVVAPTTVAPDWSGSFNW